jgi:hypothetical protein
MGTFINTAPAKWIVRHKEHAAVEAIVRRGLNACSRVRDRLRKHAAPRNPVISLKARRIARLSPCGGWCVIMPLPEVSEEIFQARHAAETGRLNENRVAD